MAAFDILDSELSDFHGKVVFVTGGSRGLGLSACLTFLSLGATVISADLTPPDKPVDRLEYVLCDITNWTNLCAAMQETVDKHTQVNVFVANAGIGEVEDFFSDEIDQTTGYLKEPKHAVVDVDLKGTMNCAKVAVHQMKKQKTGGVIVFTGSTASYVDERCIPAYMAAKHGVLGLMRAMRSTAPKFNIAVNMVAPWMTESTLVSPRHRKIMAKHGIPLNKPENVGRAIAYLSTGALNGKSVFTGRNAFVEIEEEITRLQPQWMGGENSRAWNKTNEEDFFVNASGM